jgi:hypothetical protein
VDELVKVTEVTVELAAWPRELLPSTPMAGASTCPFWSSLSRSDVEVFALKKASQFLVISAFAAAGSAGWEPAEEAEALAEGELLALGDADVLGLDDGELLDFADAE